jgi:heme/copper-type cytochrome/quinol oxidase subunit 3
MGLSRATLFITCLLFIASVVAQVANVANEKDEKKLNFGAMIGIALGCIIPILISTSFNGVDNSPE